MCDIGSRVTKKVFEEATFFNAPVQRKVFLELPPEDQSEAEDKIGELVRSLHGTRDAYLAGHLEELQFTTGRQQQMCLPQGIVPL